jgi:hypothetical protein
MKHETPKHETPKQVTQKQKLTRQFHDSMFHVSIFLIFFFIILPTDLGAAGNTGRIRINRLSCIVLLIDFKICGCVFLGSDDAKKPLLME